MIQKLFIFPILLSFIFSCKSEKDEVNNTIDQNQAITVSKPMPEATKQIEMDTNKTEQKVKISTKYGDMIVKLYDETPQHRDNFIKLAKQGYFNDLLFHRVIKDFMVQAGDPDSKNAPAGKALGQGGPGYTIPAEFRTNLIHKKGALSAARQADQVNPTKASSGSQFYIVQGKKLTDQELNSLEQRMGIKYTEEQRRIYKEIGGTPFLDQNYSVFGEVIEGLDVIDKIAAVATDANDRPKEDLEINITIEE